MWNKSNLKNPIKIQEYRRALYTKLFKQTHKDVKQEWEQIETAIIEAASEVIQMKSKEKWREWWDEDCQLAVRRKNEARRKWLQQRTRASNEWYHKQRNEANGMCASKEKEWINNLIRQIEENQK
jgi:uncharacterized protein YPO0396